MRIELGVTATLALLAGAGLACEAPTAREAIANEAVTASHYDPVSNLTFPVMLEPRASEACPADRVVGVRPDGFSDCPGPRTSSRGTWTALRLFESSKQVPIELRKYCAYDWAGNTTSDLPDVAALPTAGFPTWTGWLSPDCNVVGALSGDTLDLTWTAFRDAFFNQVERVNPLPSTATWPALTRVEVIDSAITQRTSGNPSDGQLDHGRAVGLVIERLTCPQGANQPCASWVANTLALNLERMPDGRVVRRPGVGGYFGSMSFLAEAIFKAVDRWKAQAPTDNLVLNLSIGWDPYFGGDFNGFNLTMLDPPARSVAAALYYARCEGALIFAAAGNKTGGRNPSIGPMYPGGWEENPAPNNALCSVYSINGSGPPPGVTYAPLVYSVAGVDGKDDPLASTRWLGRPPLAAPASFVTVADSTAPSGYTTAYTGSSMATAVAASAAAAAWGYQPTWNSYQVMNAVFASAIDLGVTADYQLQNTPLSTVRRVSICRAIQRACAVGGGARCPAPINCPNDPAYRDFTSPRQDLSAVPLTATVDAAPIIHGTMVGSPCGTVVYTQPGSPPPNPCVRRQYYDSKLVPFVGPQPEVPPCNLCSMDGNSLVISIHNNYTSVLTNPTVTFTLLTGSTERVDLSSLIGALAPGTTTKVTNLKFSSADSERVEMEFLVDNEVSVTDQVELW